MSLYKHAALLLLIGALALHAGCKSTATPSGVHPKAVPVGGGVDFEFEAPADGVVFIVDSQKNQLVTSRSVRAGETYRLGDNSLELVRLIGLREHGPSFILRTDLGAGKEDFPEVPSMKTPNFAAFYVTLQQMELGTDRLQPQAEPGGTGVEPSIQELEQILSR